MYGYTTDKKANDPLVDLADEVMEQFSLACQTGVWLVDTLPISKYLPSVNINVLINIINYSPSLARMGTRC